jgi:hypothetical protein
MTATATATAALVKIQVGAGRTAHDAVAGASETLCGFPADLILTAEEVATKKQCVKCARAAAALPAQEAPAEPPAATEEAPAEQGPEYRTLKGAGANGAFQVHGDLHEVHGKLVFTPWGNAKQIKGERHTFTRQWTERGGHRYLEDTEGRTVEFSGGTATKVWMVDGVPAPAAPAAEQAPAEEPEAPAVEEAPEAPAEVEESEQAEEVPAEVAEPAAPAEEADTEPAPADTVRVTAYTAAREALHINGQDNEDRTLALPASELLVTVAAMRRMPRWNAAQERFTINKVALIVAEDGEGQRVWVRGEAAPIRVDFQGNRIEEDAPAEPGSVDMAAVLAATRPLRRRAEVQRVIDNRNAARAAGAKAPAQEPTPAA